MKKIEYLIEKAEALGRIDTPKKLHAEKGKVYGIYEDGTKQLLNEEDLIKMVQELEKDAINKAEFARSDAKAPKGVNVGKYVVGKDLQDITILFDSQWD